MSGVLSPCWQLKNLLLHAVNSAREVLAAQRKAVHFSAAQVTCCCPRISWVSAPHDACTSVAADGAKAAVQQAAKRRQLMLNDASVGDNQGQPIKRWELRAAAAAGILQLWGDACRVAGMCLNGSMMMLVRVAGSTAGSTNTVTVYCGGMLVLALRVLQQACRPWTGSLGMHVHIQLCDRAEITPGLRCGQCSQL